MSAVAAKMAAGDYRFNGMQDQEYVDEYDHPNAMGGGRGGGGYLDQGRDYEVPSRHQERFLPPT